MGQRTVLMDDYHEGIRKMSEWEYPYALQLKMHEEWAEAWASPSAEELGDCLQVLKDAAKHMGIDWSLVISAQEEKECVRGGFSEMWELSSK